MEEAEQRRERRGSAPGQRNLGGLTVMRRLVVLTFAGLAIATTTSGASASASHDASVGATPTVAVQRVSLAIPAMRDEAAMVLVGAALIGLGAAVRRAG
jgi:hypothetical protein